MSKILYKGKWLFTGNENNEVIENFAMVTEGDRIIWIGKFSDEINESFDECINLGDVYVVPGFIDSHVHILCSRITNGIDYTHEGREAANIICRGAYNSKQLLKSGVVACRDLGAYNGYSLGIRDAINRGEILGPKIITCGHAICTTGGHGFEISYEADGIEEMRKYVRKVVKDGADVVKIMVSGGVNSPGPEPGPSEFTKEEIEVGIATAHGLGRKVAVHTHGNSAIRYCVEAGVDSIEHGVFMSEDIMDMMVQKGTYLVPTLCAPYYAVKEGMRLEPDNKDHAKSKEVMARHRNVLKRCSEKGVKIAFGTDAGSPYNPYEESAYEMVLMVEAGLTPLQALSAATKGSANLLGIEEELGTLEVGKKASFVCCKGNPLEDIGFVAKEKTVYLNNKKVNFE